MDHYKWTTIEMQNSLVVEIGSLVGGLFIGDAGAVFGLEFFGYLLDFAEYSEEIAAEDFSAVFGGVAAGHEGCGDLGEVGGRVEAFRQLAAYTVEI